MSRRPPDGLAGLRMREEATLRLFALTAVALAMWLLLHKYGGLVHDANLYSLAALARLHPPLADDVFLRFGSQDQYTIFSPLFATAIRAFGLESAAALLTFVSHMALMAGAWLLARRLMPRSLAILAVGLFIVLPTSYGALRIFHYTEGFLTPRLAAEALVFFSLAAALAQKRLLAFMLALGGMLLHPIMAAPGLILLALLWFVLPHGTRGLIAGGIAIAGLVTVAIFVPYGPFARVDEAWLDLLHDRSMFLFVSEWRLADWVGTIVPATLLVLGAIFGGEAQLRRLCVVFLLTGLLGLLATAVACDGLQMVNALRAQPWRWLWIMQAAAVILAPVIVRDCWRWGVLPRIAVLLTASAWIYLGQRFSLLALAMILLALVAAAAGHEYRKPRHEVLLYRGALAVFAIAAIIGTIDKLALAIGGGVVEPLSVLRRLEVTSADGFIPACILLAAWWITARAGARAHMTVAAAGVAACLLLLPTRLSAWTDDRYDSMRAAFAHWQPLLDTDAEVFWPQEPLAAWYWLNRPSYISLHQSAGIVFSRDAALELYRRARAASPLLPQELQDWAAPGAADIAPLQALKQVCANEDIGFVVREGAIEGAASAATAAPYPGNPRIKYHLYRCSDFRDP